jgi:hypothetical protein
MTVSKKDHEGGMSILLQAATSVAQAELFLRRSGIPQANEIASLLASQVSEIERLGRKQGS